MLTAEEEQELLAELSFPPEERWLQLLYRCATAGGRIRGGCREYLDHPSPCLLIPDLA